MSSLEKKNLHWTYNEQDQCGPERWSEHFQTGRYQSPINIQLKAHLHCSSSATCCAGRLKDTLNISEKRVSLSSRGSSGSSSNRSTPTLANSSDYFEEDADDGFDEQPRKSSVKQGQRALSSKTYDQQKTRLVVSNKKIFLGYPRYLNYLRLDNTGHGWQASLPPELTCHTLLTGPSLADREYRLAQFHCHWGEDCDSGSEHQIDGKSYAAEIHFVHWNCTEFKSADEAAKNKHGLAVLAVLIQAIDGEQNRNKHLDKIIAGLKGIQKSKSSVTLSHSRLDLKKLFPTNRWFYATYEGSLTTPPLSEVVDWVVFLNPIQCCSSQVEEFRKIRCDGGESMRKNCRPIQPANERLVSIWNHH